MEAWVWILVLTLVGLSLLMAEVYLPGAVAGILGGCALLTAWVLCWTSLGMGAALIYFIGMGVVGLVLFSLWLKYFHRTFAGRRMVNAETLAGAVSTGASACSAGDRGVAVTALRPAGVAKIEGRRIDVVAESAMIEAGAAVIVQVVEGARVVVAEAPKVLAGEGPAA